MKTQYNHRPKVQAPAVIDFDEYLSIRQNESAAQWRHRFPDQFGIRIERTMRREKWDVLGMILGAPFIFALVLMLYVVMGG